MPKMDTDSKSRKIVNMEQMLGLIEFMQEHPDLAKGLVRGRRGKVHSLNLWNQCAKKLNSINDGALKDGKGWSKYWCDWKYRVRRKALELKAARDNNLPPPENIVPLSAMDDRILDLIGDGAVEGVVIKCDPLAEAEQDDGDNMNDSIEDTSANNYYADSKRPRTRRHRQVEPLDAGSGPAEPGSPERKQEVPGEDSSEYEPTLEDQDSEAAEFIRLEKARLEISIRNNESLQRIANEMTRLVDIMAHIRDVLINNRVNL